MRASAMGFRLEALFVLFGLAAAARTAGRPHGQTRGWSSRTAVSDSDALHDVTYDDRGKLSFVQVRAETGTGHKVLYPVEVNFNLEEMRTESGITMVFDKMKHVMRLDSGISGVDGLAWARFDDKIDSTGWSELWVETSTSESVSNDVKMYSAGYIEGMLTCVRMSQFHKNKHIMLAKKDETSHSLQRVKALFKQQIEYLRIKSNIMAHIMTEEPKDAYWKHARYMLFQMWGVCDGYNFAAEHFGVHMLGLEDMVMLNSAGELPNLMDAFSPVAVAARARAQATTVFLQKEQVHTRARDRAEGKARIRGSAALMSRMAVHSFEKNSSLLASANVKAGNRSNSNQSEGDPLDDDHWERKVAESGRCSAFIRVTADDADLMVGHTTWDDYSDMLRVFKYYNFKLEGSETMATQIAFSGYPGVISSTDDFYAMSSGLTVMETSLEILDPYVWEGVEEFPLKPNIPNFIHVMNCNRLAKNSPMWASLFTSVNTGTYNSQWMILDYNQFTPGRKLPDNSFWVVETVPGNVNKADLTHFLRSWGYWPSFNRPYFDNIRKVTGFAAAQASHGSLYSWTDNPRATIFKNAAGAVNTLFDMRGLMNRNLYPLAGVLPNEPGHEISSRLDLSPTLKLPNGGIDAKVTNYCLMKVMQVQAISGPTHATQKAFRWKSDDGTELWPGWPHSGQPDLWNFDFVQMTPTTQGGISDIGAC